MCKYYPRIAFTHRKSMHSGSDFPTKSILKLSLNHKADTQVCRIVEIKSIDEFHRYSRSRVAL